MSFKNCRFSCAAVAVGVSAILGVLAAFLQITGVITVTPAFLWVVFGVAVVYLGVLVVASALARRAERTGCMCAAVNLVLLGILGAILVAVVLLAVGVTATSVVSAILVGLLVFFFALTFGSFACYVRCLSDCTAEG